MKYISVCVRRICSMGGNRIDWLGFQYTHIYIYIYICRIRISSRICVKTDVPLKSFNGIEGFAKDSWIE